MFARHIKNGYAMRYVGESNGHLDRLLKERKICAACGQLFSDKVKRSTDCRVCEDCLEACK
jgi:hypothetical protein